MRIAVMAHVRHPIAPPFMGGMEAHSWHLVRELTRRGHDVTLFASGDSGAGLDPDVKLVPVLDDHYDRTYPWHRYHGTDTLNAVQDAAFERACRTVIDGRFDVIHNNSLHRYPLRLSRAHRIPMVTSLHIPPFDVLRRAVRDGLSPWSRLTVTSHRQLGIWWPEGAPPQASVVSIGIEPLHWPFAPGGDGSAVWSGRLTRNKGAHLAVEAARIAGVPLTLFGSIEDRDYFETSVRPHLCDRIRYGGHVAGADLARAYAAASVFVFTPMWEEPFGLAAIEAMATGLPVAAIPNGAAREIIGDAGVYATRPTAGALATALLEALRLSPDVACRRVAGRFTTRAMVDGYEACYAQARSGLHAANVSPAVFSRIELPDLGPAVARAI